jgi:spore maturation protein CgeB
VQWPANVARTEHLTPSQHRRFYNSQRLTLNITRADMIANGYSPSVRLFEAAACGVPILSDEWRGLENFFIPGREILVARTTEEVSRYLRHLDDKYLQQIGAAARARMLAAHTPEHRARELENHVQEAGGLQPPSGLGRR